MNHTDEMCLLDDADLLALLKAAWPRMTQVDRHRVIGVLVKYKLRRCETERLIDDIDIAALDGGVNG